MNLTSAQKKAVNEIENNLQIIACAGSGKTEVISQRIANILKNREDVKPEHIVAFTFTEKAAESLKHRIQKALSQTNIDIENGMYIGTIHGFCWKFLKQANEKYSTYKILDTVKNRLFIKRYHSECGMADLGLDPYPRNISLFISCIEKLIDAYEERDQWDDIHRIVLNKYISCMEEHKYIDFSMLIFQVIQLLKSEPEMLKKLSDIKYLIVDEYQDVDDLQEQLITLISKCGANICVVGDDDQTIYQFRGSNAENMISFTDRYENVCQIRLETNFRCAKGIIDIADTVIQNNDNRITKKMTARDDADCGETIGICYDAEVRYKEIAKKVLELHKEGLPYREIAVLCRKGKRVSEISRVFHEMDIPVQANSSEQFFAGKYYADFWETITCLKDRNRAEIVNIWNKRAEAAKVKSASRRLCAYGNQVYRISELIRDFCTEIDFLNEENKDIEERRSTLDGVVNILNDYEEIYGDWQISARIDGVLGFMEYQAMQEYAHHNFSENKNEDSVQVMTVHKAKGLEFHTVFLPDLNDKEFPVGNIGGKKYWHVLKGIFEQNKDSYKMDLEDERKLFYVAVTRAKERLYVSYDLSKYPVSAFVKEAAVSKYLKINKEDLSYVPKDKAFENYMKQNRIKEEQRTKQMEEWEEERMQRKLYWEAVKYARAQLYDYYGTATHFCKGAYGDLERISKMEPDQILLEARKSGLI